MVIVHFAGYPMNIELLKKECENRDIFLIEDVAHAPGAEIDNIKCGNMGHAGFFSFFSNKNLACGEGGMVISNNKELLRKVRLLRSHGMSSVTVDRHAGRAFSYDVEHVGLNYRFDEIRASIALVQLQKLDEGNAKRQKLTEHYRQNLKNTEFSIAFDAVGTNMKP